MKFVFWIFIIDLFIFIMFIFINIEKYIKLYREVIFFLFSIKILWYSIVLRYLEYKNNRYLNLYKFLFNDR